VAQFIVFSGKKQAGKTTAAHHAADLLKREYVKQETQKFFDDIGEDNGEFIIPPIVGISTNFVKITSFAEPIKEFCINILDITEEQIYGSEEAKNIPTSYLWDNLPYMIRTRYGKSAELIATAYEPYDTSPQTPRQGPMTAREVMQVFGTDIMRESFDLNIWAKAPFRKKTSSEWVIIDDCRFPNEADISLEHGALLIRLDRCQPSHDKHRSEIAMDDYSGYNYTIKGDISIGELKQRVEETLIKEGIISGT
jgi:hypothetical protein